MGGGPIVEPIGFHVVKYPLYSLLWIALQNIH